MAAKTDKQRELHSATQQLKLACWVLVTREKAFAKFCLIVGIVCLVVTVGLCYWMLQVSAA